MSEQNQKDNSDRRKHPRVEVSTPLRFSVVMPSYDTGMVKDISEGGMCMVLDRPIAQGAIIRMEFDLPGDQSQHIEALGRIVWQRPAPEGKLLVGVKFLS